jgi:hypothetical protein
MHRWRSKLIGWMRQSQMMPQPRGDGIRSRKLHKAEEQLVTIVVLKKLDH